MLLKGLCCSMLLFGAIASIGLAIRRARGR